MPSHVLAQACLSPWLYRGLRRRYITCDCAVEPRIVDGSANVVLSFYFGDDSDAVCAREQSELTDTFSADIGTMFAGPAAILSFRVSDLEELVLEIQRIHANAVVLY